ncbi:major facilitator superfamily protein [Hirsutella rhossiliensis]|uniref:Efflux pump dotC n=1 Tax=Hirsutella rhossiliensis TaxID=111463 RepID=A0A9P8MUK4_9HYPO|nr:major facilitator superfamily domain-containing protein [Hirsutella rhossiliensis]KAH0962398.1 major facilitator superfamily domain-containing protein [Hirsutella rhossiliensis]
MTTAESPATPAPRSTSEDTTDVERDAGVVKPHEEKTTPTGSRDPEHRSGAGQLPAPAVGRPETEAATDPPESGRTSIETFLVMFALCLALFLAALDMTIITTAIPTISSHFDSSVGYVWIGSAYLLGNATFVPTWGKISDIFGRKPVLIAAVIIFWIGSLLCAVSNSMGMLIAARAIQGVGGGGTIVLPNICVSDLFSMRRRSLYFGILGGVWAVASAVGPVLGGVFTTKLSWRWCFYINLPLGGVGLAILVFVLKLHNPRTPVRQGLAAIDWLGSVLVIGGTLMLLFGLESGGVQHPWGSPMVVCLVVFGVVAVVLFALYEAFVARFPLIPVSLFRQSTSIAAFVLSFAHAFTFMSGSYWLPLYFQAVMGASSLLSGVYLLPFVLSLSLASVATGVVIKKSGNYKLIIMAGLLVMTLGFGLFISLGHDRDWAKIIIFQIIAGAGVGPNFQAPLLALQTNVEPRDIGAATSSFGFLRQLGTSISVAVGGVIFNNEMQKQHDALARSIGPELADKFGSSDAAASVQAVGTLPAAERAVVQGAYWNALQKMYIVYTCFIFAGFLVSFFIKQKKLSKTHTEHKTGLKTLKHRTAGESGEESKGGQNETLLTETEREHGWRLIFMSVI